jgi:hypothetical protein
VYVRGEEARGRGFNLWARKKSTPAAHGSAHKRSEKLKCWRVSRRVRLRCAGDRKIATVVRLDRHDQSTAQVLILRVLALPYRDSHARNAAAYRLHGGELCAQRLARAPNNPATSANSLHSYLSASVCISALRCDCRKILRLIMDVRCLRHTCGESSSERHRSRASRKHMQELSIFTSLRIPPSKPVLLRCLSRYQPHQSLLVSAKQCARVLFASLSLLYVMPLDLAEPGLFMCYTYIYSC